MGFGIRDRIIDTAVKVVDLVISGDLVKKARDVADTIRGKEPRYDDAPSYARPEPPTPSYAPPPPAPPAPEPAPAAAPAYKVAKGEEGWELSKDGKVTETHKRKQDAIKAGRTQARADKGTLAILKLDGAVGEEVNYGDIE